MIAYHSVHMLQSRCTLLRGPLQQAAYLLYRAITPSSPRESLTKADIFKQGFKARMLSMWAFVMIKICCFAAGLMSLKAMYSSSCHQTQAHCRLKIAFSLPERAWGVYQLALHGALSQD